MLTGRVVVARSGLLLEWNPNEVKEGVGTGIWKSVLEGKTDFWKNFHFKPCSGAVIRFLENLWCGDVPLKLGFCAINNLALNKSRTIVENFDYLGGRGWTHRLRRSLNDWEFEDLERLLRRINGVGLVPSDSDGWIWCLNRKG